MIVVLGRHLQAQLLALVLLHLLRHSVVVHFVLAALSALVALKVSSLRVCLVACGRLLVRLLLVVLRLWMLRGVSVRRLRSWGAVISGRRVTSSARR